MSTGVIYRPANTEQDITRALTDNVPFYIQRVPGPFGIRSLVAVWGRVHHAKKADAQVGRGCPHNLAQCCNRHGIVACQSSSRPLIIQPPVPIQSPEGGSSARTSWTCRKYHEAPLRVDRRSKRPKPKQCLTQATPFDFSSASSPGSRITLLCPSEGDSSSMYIPSFHMLTRLAAPILRFSSWILLFTPDPMLYFLLASVSANSLSGIPVSSLIRSS